MKTYIGGEEGGLPGREVEKKAIVVVADVLVYVGRALFQRYRTIQEVGAELYSRNVQISDSEISYLGYKFISCLAVCHQQATPKIRQSIGLSGGYVLHLVQPTMGMHRH